MTNNPATDRSGLSTGQLLGISTLLLLIDQTTKLAVKGFSLFGMTHEGMYLGESKPLLGNLLHISFTENPGMAYGIETGVPYLLGSFSIVASIFLVYLIYRTPRNGSTAGFRLALAVILGGALGNMIDRVFYGVFYGYGSLFAGHVVDFISVDVPDVTIFGSHFSRFWIFNIADSAVTVGMVVLLFSYAKYQNFQQSKKELERGEMGVNR